MNDVSSAIAAGFNHHCQRILARIHGLVDPLTDDQIWSRPYPYGNSIGHLFLHLTGNLSYYIGAQIGGTGYVRDRPLEFSDSAHYPKATLLRNFDAAVATMVEILEQQRDEDWGAAYTAKGMEDVGNRFTAFLRCAEHLSHHTGQIIYLCKEVERPQRA
jgi:uncharacterized damage-inducible protein DinB